MKSLFICLFILLFSLSSFSQPDHEFVTLIEKTNGKRLEFFAKNEDSISYSVFLRIETNNYRRSSNRPVLTTIEPNSEKHLLTLIKLANKPSEYNKMFIVNEVSQELRIRKDFDDFEINFDDALKTKQLTLYFSKDCNLCEDTKTLFEKYKIAYEQKDIIKNQNELIEALKAANKPIGNIENDVLILQTKSNVYRGIKSKKELVDILNNL
ncbi:glutaredoxin family protein [Thalassobellus citreus]|uniref:glutaredoxin family protein n=1 Tax=Thalassobellus citreus TaxID=3367752 RepID=UPI0037BBE510